LAIFDRLTAPFAIVVVSVPLVVTSPLRSPLVTDVAPLNLVRLPDAGDPVVVTVPAPAPQAAPVPDRSPALLAWTHWVEPEMPVIFAAGTDSVSLLGICCS
jgi:hypothetical protein